MFPLARRARVVLGATASAAIAVGVFGAFVSSGDDDVRGTAAVSVVDQVAAEDRTPPQLVLQSVTIKKADPGSRVAPSGTPLWRFSPTSSHDLPDAALRAYRAAAVNIADDRPECGLPWWLLAGIGRVESDHGRYGGSVLGSDGVARPSILGVPLNGAGPVAAIADTDNGRWDGDLVWDRAVGPMQFIPSTWAFAGRDGDGDGIASPNDLDDAALAAAAYLCPVTGSILPEAAMRAAVYRYNHSDYYVDLVLAFAKGYQSGVFTIPAPPAVQPVRARGGRPGNADQPPGAAPHAGDSTQTPSASVEAGSSGGPSHSSGSTPSGSLSGSPSGSATSSSSGSSSGSPSGSPTESPTSSPSGSPSGSPTESPTGSPSGSPSPTLSESPRECVSSAPSGSPSGSPSESPTECPSSSPSGSVSSSLSPSTSDSPADSASAIDSATPTPTP